MKRETIKMICQAGILFFSKWLQAPLRVASMVPSGAQLVRAMASALPPGTVWSWSWAAGGTGPVTHALLDAWVAADRLIVIEHEAHFCQYFKRQFPAIQICQGNAIDQPIRAVVSGLPLLTMNPKVQTGLLQQVLQVVRWPHDRLQ